MFEKFESLFKKYGYMVETVGNNSYIAKNDTFFVAFSVYDSWGTSVAAMGSYLLCDLDEFVAQWKERANDYTIGQFAFSVRMNCGHGFQHQGLWNHDHMLHEVEYWLQRNSHI